jgi:hypothetical protein
MENVSTEFNVGFGFEITEASANGLATQIMDKHFVPNEEHEQFMGFVMALHNRVSATILPEDVLRVIQAYVVPKGVWNRFGELCSQGAPEREATREDIARHAISEQWEVEEMESDIMYRKVTREYYFSELVAGMEEEAGMNDEFIGRAAYPITWETLGQKAATLSPALLGDICLVRAFYRNSMGQQMAGPDRYFIFLKDTCMDWASCGPRGAGYPGMEDGGGIVYRSVPRVKDAEEHHIEQVKNALHLDSVHADARWHFLLSTEIG